MPSETKPAFLKAGFVVFKAELFGTIFQRVFISIKIRCTDKGCATETLPRNTGIILKKNCPQVMFAPAKIPAG